MYCNQCGQTVSEGARFCAACGARLAPPGSAPGPAPATGPGAWTGTSQAATPGPGPATGPGTWAGTSQAATPGPLPPGPPAPPPVAAAATGSGSTSAYGTPPYTPGPPAYPPAAPFPAAAPEATPAVRYAGFWRRFWGLFLDRFALGIVLVPVGLLFGFNLLSEVIRDGGLTPDRFVTLVFGSMSMALVRTFAEWVYFSAFQSSARQATPGQMLLGLRVVGLDGGRIGFGRATGRYFASWISAAILLVGFIMGAFTERKQTLHDMIAGTLVVRDSPGRA